MPRTTIGADQEFRNAIEVDSLPNRLHDAQQVPAVAAGLGELAATAWSFARESNRADTDIALSPEGRAIAINRVSKIENEALDRFWETVIEPMLAREQAAKQALLAPASGPTDPAQAVRHELRLQEVRSMLRGLDPLEVESLYLATSDALLLEAIETAPPVIFRETPTAAAVLKPLVDPAHVERRQLARLEAANPQAAHDLADIGTIVRTYQSAVASVRKAIQEATPPMPASLPVEAEPSLS